MLFNTDGKNAMLDRLGYTGADIEQKERAMWVDQGFTYPHNWDAMFAYLGSLGYTGTLQDRMNQWIAAGGYSSLEEFFANHTFGTQLLNANFFADFSLSTTTAYKNATATPVAVDNDALMVIDDANSLALLVSTEVSGFNYTYKSGPPQSMYTNVVATASRIGRFYASTGPGLKTGTAKLVSDFVGAAGTTVCIVVKSDTLTDTTHQGIVGSGTVSQFGIRNYQSAGLYYARGTAWDGASKSVTIQTPTAGNWFVFSLRHNGTTLEGRVNQGAWTQTACGSLTALTGELRLGVSDGLSRGFYGNTGGVAFWKSALSDGDLAAVEDAFAATYSITF